MISTCPRSRFLTHSACAGGPRRLEIDAGRQRSRTSLRRGPPYHVVFGVNSIDPSLLSNNLEGLASSAKALDVPVILTTVSAEGGKLRDPLMRVMGAFEVYDGKIN